MKKKLFLITLMVALFACVFAISISAASFVSDYTTEVTELGTGPDWADLDDKNATAVLKKADGTYIRIPLYYIYQEKGTEFMGDIRDESNQNSSGFRYAWISEQLGETVTHANLVALEIPQGTTKLNNNSNKFSSATPAYSALTELVIPTSVTGLSQSLFRNNPIIERVFIKQTKNADGTVSGLTTLPGWFADVTDGNVTSKLREFNFELDYVTSIGSNAFMKSALETFTVKAPIASFGSTIFCGCKSLKSVNLDNTSGTTVSIGSKAFASCTSLESVTLNGFSFTEYLFESANGLTNGGLIVVATNVGSIGQMAFKNTTNLSSVTLSGVTSLGNSVFLNCSNLKTVDVSGPITSIGNDIFSGSKNVESAIIRVIGNPFPDATNVGSITSIVSKDVYEADKNAYATGKHLVYGYNLCQLLYNGVHAESEGVTYTYIDKNGNPTDVKFLSTLKISSQCGRNCGEENVINMIDPLFECLGCSASMTGINGIAVGFKVNNEAIIEYQEEMGVTITYGVFAVSQAKLGENDVFDTEGNAIEDSITANLTSYEFATFEVKVVGFADDQKGKKLALGAYVAVNNGEKTEHTYLQDDTKGDKVGNYYFVSYSDLVTA